MGTEITQIIDLKAEEVKEVQEGEKGWKLLGKLYDGALKGIPGGEACGSTGTGILIELWRKERTGS